GVELNFLRSHRLRFNDRLRPMTFHDFGDFLPRFGCVVRPNNLSTLFSKVTFEVSKITVQVFDSLPLKQMCFLFGVFQIEKLASTPFKSKIVLINILIDDFPMT